MRLAGVLELLTVALAELLKEPLQRVARLELGQALPVTVTLRVGVLGRFGHLDLYGHHRIADVIDDVGERRRVDGGSLARNGGSLGKGRLRDQPVDGGRGEGDDAGSTQEGRARPEAGAAGLGLVIGLGCVVKICHSSLLGNGTKRFGLSGHRKMARCGLRFHVRRMTSS